MLEESKSRQKECDERWMSALAKSKVEVRESLAAEANARQELAEEVGVREWKGDQTFFQ